jgi:hypothetical protein
LHRRALRNAAHHHQVTTAALAVVLFEHHCFGIRHEPAGRRVFLV